MRTRQYILEVTERMLQTRGLARLTNKEIAEAAGCAEGTLYKHFETKEALILAAIEENVPDFLSVVGEDRLGEGAIEENVQDIARAAMRYYRKLLPLTTAVFADSDLLAHFRLWMQEHQGGPFSKRVNRHEEFPCGRDQSGLYGKNGSKGGHDGTH